MSERNRSFSPAKRIPVDRGSFLHSQSSAALSAQPRPKESSFTQDLKEIAKIKQAWQDASATEESKKLQAQIEERKENARLTKRKEEAIIMKRSKDCRKFYREQYKEQRQSEKREVEELNKRVAQVRKVHREKLRGERDHTNRERAENYHSLRQRIRTASEVRAQDWKHEREQHYLDYAQAKELYPLRIHQRRRLQRDEIEDSRRLESQAVEDLRGLRRQEQIEWNESARAIEERKSEKRESLRELKERRRQVETQEAKRIKHESRQRHHVKQQRKEIEDLEESERPSRVQLISAERKQRWELTNLFQKVVSSTYMYEVHRTHKERSEAYRSTLTPVLDSSDFLRAQERSNQRVREAQRREQGKLKRLETLQNKAFDFRKGRLEKIKEYVSEQCDQANMIRVKTLERRRGEKMVTETEAYQVADDAPDAVSQMPEYLPSHLARLVSDIVRGKTTKEEIDLYQI